MKTRYKGFTLIELIASVVGVAVGCGLIYGGYQGVRALNKYIDTPTIKVERANVIGGETAERFIEFDGQRYYSEVDGKRIEDKK